MTPRWQRWLGAGALLLAASPLLAPELLASPDHQGKSDPSVVSVAPVDRATRASVVTQANRLAAADALGRASRPLVAKRPSLNGGFANNPFEGAQ